METVTQERETEYQAMRGLMRATRAGTPTARLLRRALAEELTPRQAELVRMYYVEQRTMADVAAELGVNVSTVSRTLAAARRRLRRCLKYLNRSFLRQED